MIGSLFQIIHLMSEKARIYCDLEKIWDRGKVIYF